MDQVHSTTEHRKGEHISFEERVVIQTRLKDGWTPNRIAGELGRAPKTVRNEIKRGTVTLYRGNIFRHKAKVGQTAYEKISTCFCTHLISVCLSVRIGFNTKYLIPLYITSYGICYN